MKTLTLKKVSPTAVSRAAAAHPQAAHPQAARPQSKEEIRRKLARLHRQTARLRQLEATDPLPPEFYEILANPIRFSHKIAR
ncbi:hypothetical protein FACS1894139_04990 [Planctomycetales bacterium]|nr:hypothetical protein FACS1894107_03270 [Planctomycetales bacterium]GHS97038.1 hypothetical protein FACS1894108_02730 [Planctomycetales bacterium]GHT03828.1 hypothetical protein FACS1894139_04990 [Planctomycetales bacterium]